MLYCFRAGNGESGIGNRKSNLRLRPMPLFRFSITESRFPVSNGVRD